MLRVAPCSPTRLRCAVAAWALASLAACASKPPTPGEKPIAVRNGDGFIHLDAEGTRVASVALRTGDPLIVSALCAPDGTSVLRVDAEDAREPGLIDHSAQRSLWVAYGDIDGVDAWERPDRIRLVRYELSFGAGGALRLRAFLEWRDERGALLLNEERSLRFTATDLAHAVDVDITFTAPPGGARFGDTVDGLLALALDERFLDPADAVWFTAARAAPSAASFAGEASRWIGATSRSDAPGARVTVAVLDHPGNLRHPARWRTRPDGVLAANPFGSAAFTNEASLRPALTLDALEALRLRYRVVVTSHASPTDVDPANAAIETERVEAAWRAFAGEPQRGGDARD